MNCNEFSNELEAYVAGELTDTRASEVRRHVEGCGECAKALRSINQLQLAMRRLGPQPMPGRVQAAILSKAASAASRPHRPFFATGRFALAGTGIAVIAAIAVSCLFFRQSPADAQAIIAKAQAAVKRYKSWHVVYQMTSHNAHTGKKVIENYEEWFKAPGETKLQSLDTPLPLGLAYAVHDGVRTELNICQGVAMRYPITRAEQTKLANRNCALSVDPNDEQYKFFEHVTARGTVQFRGRLCEVIEGDYTHGPFAVGETYFATTVTYYIDRETGLVIRRLITRDGNVVTDRVTIKWELDIPIPDSAFDVTPPADWTVVKGGLGHFGGFPDNLLPPEAAQGMIRSAMDQTSGSWKMPFDVNPVWYPLYIPDGYRFCSFTTAEVAANNGHVSAVELSYVLPNAWDVVSIVESAKDSGEGGEPIDVDGFDGSIIKGTKPYPYVRLSWKAGEVFCTLTASSISQDEAIKIAKSFQPM